MAHRDDEDGVESVSAALGWEDTRRGDWKNVCVDGGGLHEKLEG